MLSFDFPILESRVIDGDSLELVCDLGFNVSHRTKCRLVGIDAPEIQSAAGKLVREVVREWIKPVAPSPPVVGPQSTYRWRSSRLDKYGRSLGDIVDIQHPQFTLVSYLMQKQIVRQYTGSGSKAVWYTQELAAIVSRCQTLLENGIR